MLGLIYQSVIRKRWKFMLLVIQFSIGFIALLLGLSCINNVLQYKKNIEKISPLKTAHLFINGEDETKEYSPQMVEKYREIFSQIKKSNFVNRVGLFELMDVFGESYDEAERLYVLNQDSLEMTNFDLRKGDIKRLLNYHQEKKVPIVISGKMENHYKLGESYIFHYIDESCTEKEVEVEVVGVLESRMCYWRGGSSVLSENILKNQLFILAPKFTEYSSELTYMCNSLLEFGDENKAREEIEEILQREKISGDFTTLQGEVDAYYKSQKTIFIGMLLFAGLLLLLALLGSIGAILAEITSRYREFGIYYSLGCSEKKLAHLVMGEIIVVFLTSFLLATVISAAFCTFIFGDVFILNVQTVFAGFVIMSACVLLCSVMPLFKMKKLEPIELIRGVNE